MRAEQQNITASNSYDVIVIGAGPAGMAAALGAAEKSPKSRIALIEREEHLGGILKQCIHDGFGLAHFKERLTGPEYAWRYRNMIARHPNIEVFLSTFLRRIEPAFFLTVTNPQRGIFTLYCKSLISATGCRERTDRQIFIHGERPSGIFTAGQAQAFINLKGYLPGKRCLILGSGDIGLIMARRLTLEGCKVLGVYEAKAEASGLNRNIVQCLEDYDIPLCLGTTVAAAYGKERLEGVQIVKVDEAMRPVSGTEEFVACDTLIVSVGLIPENDILDSLLLEMDERTRGPKVNQYMETNIAGLFCCGNALHVNDLVDYVSESGRIAGEQAVLSAYSAGGATNTDNGRWPSIPLEADKSLLYQVPAYIKTDGDKAVVFFRTAKTLEKAKLLISVADKIIFQKKYEFLRPPEMERIILDTALIPQKTQKIACMLEADQ